MKIEYNNFYIHFVFTTFNRLPIIVKKNRQRIEKYITGTVNNNGCQLYAIYANPEHLHFFVSLNPSIDAESLAAIIADSSEIFINENKLCAGLFHWQRSCSTFSVSKRDVDKACKYILNQQEHHKKVDYSQEYDTFLKLYQQTIDKNKK
jgi:REP element-mobilizing transposase RayT